MIAINLTMLGILYIHRLSNLITSIHKVISDIGKYLLIPESGRPTFHFLILSAQFPAVGRVNEPSSRMTASRIRVLYLYCAPQISLLKLEMQGANAARPVPLLGVQCGLA